MLEKPERSFGFLRDACSCCLRCQDACLTLCWGQPTQCGMGTDGVVESLYVGKYVCLGAGLCGVVLEVDQLTLEAAEEIFCHGVIAGGALAGHALPDSIGLLLLPEGGCGVLDAPATVKDEPLGWFAAAYCHIEGFQRQGSVDTIRKSIVHNFSAAQVLDDG